MGAAQSTNASNIVNETLASIVSSQTALCRSSNIGVQSIKISDIHGGKGCKIKISGVSQQQVQVSTLDCRTSQQLSAKITEELTQKLKQKADSDASGIMVPNSISTNLLNNINKLSSTININQMSECIKSVMSAQNINLNDITCGEDGSIDIENIQQKLDSKSTATCLLQQSAATDLANKINNDFAQAAEAKSSTTMISGISSSVLSCMIIIIIVILLQWFF
jgi:hypothetical protein